MLRDEAFTVTGGTVRRATRVNDRKDRREIHVQPSGSGAVSITLPATTNCDSAGAICTSDGRPLSNSASVLGPFGISVADARVEEGVGAVLAFAVTLSRAATNALTVDYATSYGRALAGEDYTAVLDRPGRLAVGPRPAHPSPSAARTMTGSRARSPARCPAGTRAPRTAPGSPAAAAPPSAPRYG